jgi:penicillin-binding protein 2
MQQNKKQRSDASVRIIKIGMIVLVLIIMGRLFQLQILQYDKYSPISRQNALRQEIISPARGLVFDRNGDLLVDNEPIYSITVTPAKYDTAKTPLLAKILNIPVTEMKERIDKATAYSWQRSSKVFTEIDFETFSLIEENIWKLPGVGHQIESKRHYPVDSLQASHLFGYLREVSEKEYLESDKYHLGDKNGKSGIEQQYNDRLWGEIGTEYTLVNAMGQSLGSFDEGSNDEAPVKGNSLYTTVDADLQVLAEDLMEGKVGAVVALNPQDGGILAMVSAPQYDIRKLSGRIDGDYWQSINTNPENPLYNRAISSRQPPGSTFKPMMALIGLDMGIITPQTTVYNPGYYYRGRRYGDHADKGTYNLTKAIQNSSNTYFFWMMDKIASGGKLNQWHDMAVDFGLGVKTGIDLPYETDGILPDSAYFNSEIGVNKWGLGDVLNLGIGQGYVSTSPLQMALMTAEIANNGYRIRPHIVHTIQRENGEMLKVNAPREKIDWVDQSEIDIVKQGMRQVVTEGSGRYYADLDSVKTAGKTGTAQNPHGEDHGWYVAFAPLDDPKIAIAVLMENSGFGSQSASPVAGLLMEQYLTGGISAKREWIYDYVKNFKPKNDQTAALNAER